MLSSNKKWHSQVVSRLFVTPSSAYKKLGWQQWERVIIWQVGSDAARPTVGWNLSEKAKRSFQKIRFPLPPFRGLKRLVKNLSKRSEQQQLKLVRSLVTLTVREWVRSQMYTLFWDFCKIENHFRISGEEMIDFLCHFPFIAMRLIRNICYICWCDILTPLHPSRVWLPLRNCNQHLCLGFNSKCSQLSMKMGESTLHIPHDRIMALERLSDRSNQSCSSNLSNLQVVLSWPLQ